MPLVTSTEMFARAYEGKYAVGAFNVNNLEIIQGIVWAAAKTHSPLILQVSRNARVYADPLYLKHMIDAAVEAHPELPIVCHLDHGDDFETCKDCIDAGFTSVMIDASDKPFAENVALTKQVVEYAHPRGVVVEAELGRLQGIEDNISVAEADAILVNVDEAVQFVAETGVDSLAVAVGTSHGAYKFKGEAKLDFNRIEELTKRLPNFPLVLHGASSVLPEFVEKCNKYGGALRADAKGVPEDMLRRAGTLGVCKINIDTDIRLAFTATIREHFATHPEDFDPRKYLAPARQAVQDMVEHKIVNVLGSANKI